LSGDSGFVGSSSGMLVSALPLTLWERQSLLTRSYFFAESLTRLKYQLPDGPPIAIQRASVRDLFRGGHIVEIKLSRQVEATSQARPERRLSKKKI